MKQKVVIRVSMNDQKSMSKALKTVVGVCGVEAASLQGQEKDKIEVTGEGIDAIQLTMKLRKHIGFSELVSVGPVGEKEEKKPDPPKGEPLPLHPWPYAYGGGVYPFCQIYPSQEPSCSIM